MPKGVSAWQMPQGGIDGGETPKEAVMRELHEETGTDKAEMIAESRDWLTYDLPPAAVAHSRHGRYRGQKQKWFLMRFIGNNNDIDINGHHAEFNAWKWVMPGELPELIVDFKRPVYVAVLEEFREQLGL
jgi:putative (di)nucleoside polyphosphate hydrolase